MTEEVKAPALAVWQTSVPLSVIGVVLNRVVSRMPLFSWQLYLTVMLAMLVFSVIYALWIFPSLFRDKPVLRDHQLISFLNCFVGGIIFGLIWNWSLTKGQKGISNFVFLGLTVLMFVLSFFNII
ncbi:hypothetical protein [Pseudolactococcus reticulitermitis]|uniref:Uncharacterized protein n=1 Tax=Pseudolactococcus reticulitermitis TaxID=2025039 RepID=A0A224XAL4_9LACT|nr:hypothetical protein [Lactococcus reticulitermitis]GAX46711.1 hypothetical protein RsY01_290 [Lactococcus reticulitermitis]